MNKGKHNEELDHFLCQKYCDQGEYCEYWTFELTLSDDKEYGRRNVTCILLQDKASQAVDIGWISGSKGCIRFEKTEKPKYVI